MNEQERFTFKKIKVAAVQAESAFLDLDKATEIACTLIRQAGAEKADLIGFPETFLPCFPNWYETHGESPLTRNFDKELFKHSVEVPGSHVEAVADACRQARINAVIGVNERVGWTTGTMYNTQIHINRSGAITGKHQKYVPTTGERQVHTPGQTGYQNTFMTDFGPVSGLICGENSNPLGQYAAMLSYPVVHVAAWPIYYAPYFPMHHAIHTASAGLAFSLKCFVINSVSRISEDYIAAVATDQGIRDFLVSERQKLPGATILDPVGRVIADGSGNPSDLLFADIDLEAIIVPKLICDFGGHYNRPDLFAPLFAQKPA